MRRSEQHDLCQLRKELREATGAGMMDCKRALEETGGDLEEAKKYLREKGLARPRSAPAARPPRARSRSTSTRRTARWSPSAARPSRSRTTRSSSSTSNASSNAVEKHGEQAADELEGERVELSAKLGENIVVRGAVRFEAAEDEVLAGYVHPPANKIGVLAPRPRQPGYRPQRGDAHRLRGAAVPDAGRGARGGDNAERDILSKQPDLEGKPDEVKTKIVDGRIQKWLSEERPRRAGVDPRLERRRRSVRRCRRRGSR